MTAVTRLVADVGGTNTRVALFDEASGQYRAISSYNNREFQGLEQVFEQWLAQLSEPRPSAACIAIAAALAGDFLYGLQKSFPDPAIPVGLKHHEVVDIYEGLRVEG